MEKDGPGTMGDSDSDLISVRAREAFAHIADPQKRAYLVAYAITFNRTESAKIAGVEITRPWTKGWKNDRELQAALEVAREIAFSHLEGTVKRRAEEGQKRYKFDKDGTPLRHPDVCDCGHQRLEHMSREVETVVGKGKAERTTTDVIVGAGPCPMPGCGCQRYRGAPYYEQDFSDKLVEMLLRANAPDRYGDKLKLSVSGVLGVLSREDVQKLFGLAPNEVLARITDGGEAPHVVLAEWMHSLGGEAQKLLGRGAPNDGPGDSEEIGGPPGPVIEAELVPEEGSGPEP